MPGETILLADDEADIGEILGLFLQTEGYRMKQAFSGAETVALAKELSPQLIVLDVLLPDTDGYELCKQLRMFTKAPILFLSCKDNELDRIIGLSVGGDDYIGKPFSPNEVLARIKAHLRRSRMYQGEDAHKAEPPHMVVSRSLKVDLKSHDVFVDGRPVELSVKEFRLLVCFMNHPRQVLTSEQLLRNVWGHKAETDSKTLHVHIGTLRKKIEKDPAHPKHIVTLRGAGYKFCDEAEAV
ncbi:two-component system, OmpR family, response regulator VicR [Cohnella sp. OV330]|uniref:winged helix-turn-helix domain-containing protein n=1 Tax=Cohnella sp. OV330 TaxID=1855288 RepID=UPI0008F287BC|nr:response regulator transcription factor [Cohnella sp. OV330]SFB49479.1 two-component system, OmpR family, response regulator VicR [Cohnella sp. OV330]